MTVLNPSSETDNSNSPDPAPAHCVPTFEPVSYDFGTPSLERANGLLSTASMPTSEPEADLEPIDPFLLAMFAMQQSLKE